MPGITIDGRHVYHLRHVPDNCQTEDEYGLLNHYIEGALYAIGRPDVVVVAGADEGWPAIEDEHLEVPLRYAVARALNMWRRRPGQRKPGRPRIHLEPRRKVTMMLPTDLLDAIPGEMTAFIETALREKLEREPSEGNS